MLVRVTNLSPSCDLSTPESHHVEILDLIKFNLARFRHIRNNLTAEASKLYISAVILDTDR